MSKTFFDSLEPRTLLSFAAFGSDTAISSLGTVVSTDAAVADNGSFIVASAVNHKGNYTLQAQRFGADGSPVGQPLTLMTLKGGFIRDVSVSMDADGDAVVAYSATSDTFFGGTRIYVSRVSKTGTASTPALVAQAADLDEDLSEPTVSMDSGGGYYVAWSDEVGRTPSVQVHAFTAAGKSRAKQFNGGPGTSLTFIHGPRIASKPDGSSAILTYDYFGESFQTAPIHQVSPSALVGSAGLFNDGDKGLPLPAVHSDGSFVVAYQQFTREDLGDSFAQRFDPSAMRIGDPIKLLGTTETSLAYRVDIDTLPDGGFVAAFRQLNENSQTMVARRYTASGTAESAAVEIATDPSTNDFGRFLLPRIDAENENGSAIVSYIGRSDSKTHFQRFTSDIAALDNGTLYVAGTGDDDSISVNIKALSIVVQRGTTVRKFDASKTNSLSINGAAGNDSILNGTSLPSTILGGDGNDFIRGGLGNDDLRGNGGDDTIAGNDGNDRLLGDGGRDSLFGNGGADRIDGGPGADVIRAHDGADKLFGGAGNDRLFGGSGSDSINGEGGDDQIFGESDVDLLHGNAGNDLLVAAEDGARDRLFGDAGTDTSDADKIDLVSGIEVTT